MAALSAFLTSSVWQLAGRGQSIAALGGGMAQEGRRKGFHTENTENPRSVTAKTKCASRKVPAPSSVAFRVISMLSV
jgi:hypothetical protein